MLHLVVVYTVLIKPGSTHMLGILNKGRAGMRPGLTPEMSRDLTEESWRVIVFILLQVLRTYHVSLMTLLAVGWR